MSAFRDRAAGYLRDAPGGVNLEKVAVYGALAFALYLVYKTVRVGAAVKGALNATGSAIGGAAFDLFNPSAGERAVSTQYVVYFDREKTFHAVDSLDVNSNGQFARGGKRYQLIVLRSPRSIAGRTVSKVAVPL